METKRQTDIGVNVERSPWQEWPGQVYRASTRNLSCCSWDARQHRFKVISAQEPPDMSRVHAPGLNKAWPNLCERLRRFVLALCHLLIRPETVRSCLCGGAENAGVENAASECIARVHENIFVPFVDSAFPFVYALMMCKTLCQSIRESTIGLKESNWRDADVAVIVHCLLGLPLLAASDISDAVSQIQQHVNAGSAHDNGLQQLIAYVLRHWICKRSIGPERPGVSK